MGCSAKSCVEAEQLCIVEAGLEASEAASPGAGLAQLPAAGAAAKGQPE